MNGSNDRMWVFLIKRPTHVRIAFIFVSMSSNWKGCVMGRFGGAGNILLFYLGAVYTSVFSLRKFILLYAYNMGTFQYVHYNSMKIFKNK